MVELSLVGGLCKPDF